jgi:hypothetical protein
LAACLGLWTAGCDHPDDSKSFDHIPPEGLGALIVDNLSPTDINVYVDGSLTGRVNEDSDQAFDLPPGAHRVVFDEVDGNRAWGQDVDILNGRLTVLWVTLDTGNRNGYRVRIEFD